MFHLFSVHLCSVFFASQTSCGHVAVLCLQLVSRQAFATEAFHLAGPGPQIHRDQLQGIEPSIVQGPQDATFPGSTGGNQTGTESGYAAIICYN